MNAHLGAGKTRLATYNTLRAMAEALERAAAELAERERNSRRKRSRRRAHMRKLSDAANYYKIAAVYMFDSDEVENG